MNSVSEREMKRRLSDLGYEYTETVVERRESSERIRCDARSGDHVIAAFWFKGNESADNARLSILCEVQDRVISRIRHWSTDIYGSTGDWSKLEAILDGEDTP